MRIFWVCLSVFLLLLSVSCVTPARVPLPEPKPVVVQPLVEIAPTPVQTPADGGKFSVSQEKYSASLKEIRDFVDTLNSIISQKKIEDWKSHLDSTYPAKYSDPVFLKQVVNDSAMLKQYEVKLKSLSDYFDWVVVPSRSKVVVDDITFLDENRVEAFTIIKNQKILLYQLKLSGKEWKISFW